MTDLAGLLDSLREFQAWATREARPSTRFQRAYKERAAREIFPRIREFIEKYAAVGGSPGEACGLVQEIFSWLKGATSLMATELRPSVGMGVFLERWMMTQASEEYLAVCGQRVAELLDRLTKLAESHFRQAAPANVGSEPGG